MHMLSSTVVIAAMIGNDSLITVLVGIQRVDIAQGRSRSWDCYHCYRVDRLTQSTLLKQDLTVKAIGLFHRIY